ncbi:MAG TPA: response regulator [Aliidongia sp.]|uniref:response regulator n=1 Tax=Aliidongia sp. TaxID=1914230 RepID=UPI002DDD5686|nr:response regulator [Aliidongia sp.]HEV2677813.1 response regulator [Aliidongia sp.]
MSRILVIDDDPIVRSFISEILEERGHSATVAPDGRAGLVLFRSTAFDLVVTDIVMPEQEGIATIGAIRRLNTTIPILAVSGSKTVGRYGDYLHAAKLTGASAVMRKPLMPDPFMEVVDGLLMTMRDG